jgi:MYXO-CTERM domain-containing protein
MNFRCEMGRCVAPAGLGMGCMTNAQCGAGGFCSGGVCCNTACTGACESCILQGSAGRCSPLPANTQVRDAGTNGSLCVCTGTSGTCRADVTPDASTPDVTVSMDVAVPVQVIYTGAGCGCSAPGTSNTANGALGVTLAALALVVTRRRARR